MAATDPQVADPIVRLEDDVLSVEPGGEVRATLHVRNAGRVVERFTFEVLGPAADFATVVPAELSLLPDAEGVVDLVVRPPVGTGSAAGEVPVGVRCRSGVDQFHASVAEGVLAIGAVHDVETRVVPLKARGRWRGRYVVRCTNTGNATTEVVVEPRDDDQALGFAWAPERLTLDRGATGRAYVSVRPRAPFLLGSPRRAPFTIEVERTAAPGRPDPTARTELPASFEQRAVGPKRGRGLLVAALGGVGLLTALAVLWPRSGPGEGVDAPPPPAVLTGVTAEAHDEVRVTWAENPTANGFLVQRLQPGSDPAANIVEEEVAVGGNQRTEVVGGLAPQTQHCFVVVGVNDAGAGGPSDALCADTPAAPVEETPDEEGAGDGGGGDGDGATEDPTTDGTTSEETSTDGDATTPDDGATATDDPDGVQERDVQDSYAILASFVKDDVVLREEPLQRAVALRDLGIPALLFDSDASQVLTQEGFWFVLVDGFDTIEDAEAFCTDNADALATLEPPGFCQPFP